MKNPIHRYTELKDELMDYTDDFHDAMMYDIEGYYSEQLMMRIKPTL